LDLFIADFNQTSILNIVQKHAEYFEHNIHFGNDKLQQIFYKNLKNMRVNHQVKNQMEGIKVQMKVPRSRQRATGNRQRARPFINEIVL